MLPLWLFVVGAVSQCTVPQSKIITSYDFTEYQNTKNANANALSSNGNSQITFDSSKMEWLSESNGVEIKSLVETTGIYNLSGLTSFSFEIWLRCATDGKIFAIRPKQDPDHKCTPDSDFLALDQGSFTETMIGSLSTTRRCQTTSGDIFSKNNFLGDPDIHMGYPPREMFTFTHHVMITIDNDGERLGTVTKTKNPIAKIYVDGQENDADDDRIGLFDRLNNQDFLPHIGWDEVNILINPQNVWKGNLYKFALYNEALDVTTVKSIFDNCCINNKPYSPSFTQYIDEDTVGTIELNGCDAIKAPKRPSIKSLNDQGAYLQSSPYKSDIPFKIPVDSKLTDQTKRIVGETKLQLGTKIYDVEGGDDSNTYGFRITKMPSNSLEFKYQGAPVDLNVLMGPADSVSLQYKAQPNAQSWSYSLVDGDWSRTEYDSFQYQVYDGKNWSDAATVSIGIDPKPDPPTDTDKTYSVGAGSHKEIPIFPSEQLVDAYAGVTEFKIDTVIVTDLPTEGNLTYCIARDCCSDSDQWAPVVRNEKLKGQSSFCLRYTAQDAQASPGEGGNAVLGTDSFKYKLLYGDDTPATIFLEAVRLGPKVNVDINIQNPYYPRGDAPFGGNPEECLLVEDEKKPVPIDYNAPTSYKLPMKFEIEPLPEDFQGTLTVTDLQGTMTEWTAQNRGTKTIIGSDGLHYEAPKDTYTKFTKMQLNEGIEPGYYFNFTLIANINGQELRSILGTQKLCVAPRNDLPEFLSLKISAPSSANCCPDIGCDQEGIDKLATWSTSNGHPNGFVEDQALASGIITPGATADFYVDPLKCMAIEYDWDDRDADLDAEYEIEFSSKPDQLRFFLTHEPAEHNIIVGTTPGRIGSLVVKGKYMDVRDATKKLIKFQLMTNEQVALEIKINDLKNSHTKLQIPDAIAQVSLGSTTVRLEAKSLKADPDGGVSGENIDLFGIGLSMDSTSWFGAICGIVGALVCCCVSCCAGFFKFQMNRARNDGKKIGGMGPNMRGGFYGQSDQVHLGKLQKVNAKNGYKTPGTTAASLKKM